MNANEVLANRAAEILGEPRGVYTRVHPNDHVNMGQSTNDVVPTATRLALLLGTAPLVAAGQALVQSLTKKADAFAHVLKTGRTHLQDAVPITLGQEFSGYAECVRRGTDDVEEASAAVARTEHRRHRRWHEPERRRRFPPARRRSSRALHQPAAHAGAQSVSA
jgi:aspartate ammonia-lyase